jgi:hypothetical protein
MTREGMVKARYEQGLIPQNIFGNVKLSRKKGNRLSCASWKKCKKLLSLAQKEKHCGFHVHQLLYRRKLRD